MNKGWKLRAGALLYAALMKGSDAVRLAICVAVTFLAGWIGSVASSAAPEFYTALERPAWAPPSWLFGPVWTILYLMMAVAAWLVWRRAGGAARWPLALFAGQLALNALWTWLFFAWRMGGAALAEILVLWLAIAATIYVFSTFSRTAAALLVPYLAWVTYAAALTAALWLSNPGVL